MANTLIQLKSSTANASPNVLDTAEPAYSYVSNTLFIGTAAGTGVLAIGGQAYVAQQQTIYNTVNAAFTVANTGGSGAAGSYANSGFAVANSAALYANAAFLAANNASDSWVRNQANSAFIQANAAFATANTVTAAGSYANAAFAIANNASGVNLTQNTSITAAFLQANTPDYVANSAASYANAAFATANTITAAGSYANAAFITANTVTAAGAYANASFLQANTPSYVANSAASYANAAFAAANTKFNSSGGTISGDTSITGNLTVTGTTTYTNTINQLIGDNIVTLNADVLQSTQPTESAGIEINRGAQPNAQFIWVETAGKWSANNGNGSIYIAADSAETYANAAFAAANAATATDTTQNTSITAAFLKANTPSDVANSAASYANAAFATANTITAAGEYANAAFAAANTAGGSSSAGPYANAAFAVANSASSYANAAFLAANNAGGSVVANTITLGTPTDGSLSNVGAYTAWTTATKVADAIDDLNEMMDNVRANTFVKSVTFTASPAAAGSGSTITLTLVPVTANGTIKYDIDWGDASFSNNATGTSQTHVYTAQGSKTIIVRAFNASGAGTGSEASNTSAGIVVIYTADPTMGYSFFRSLTGGTALVAGSTMYVTEGETFYLQNDTTNTTGSAVTYIANFGDNVANTTIASDTSAGGVFGARLPYSYGFTKSSGTSANTINLVMTSSNTANPASIPRSISTVSMKIYDANIATPQQLSTKTITFANTVGTSPLLAAQFANNTGGATTYVAGSSVNRTTATASNTSTVTLTTIAYNANSGTLTANFNGANSGARGLTSGSDTGSYNSLTIDSKKDYQLFDATGTATTFGLSIYAPSTFAGFTATATKAASAVPVGVNNFQLLHSANGNTNIVEFVKDDLTTVPTTTAGSVSTVTAGTYRYISGIPYFNSGSPTVKLSGATIVNWIGQTYISCTAPVLVTSGTNAESTTAAAITPTTFTYSGIDNSGNTFLSSTFPKANTGAGGIPYTLGDLTVSVANSVRTIQQIGIRANNVNGLGALVQNTSTKLAVHSTAQSGISEIAITVSGITGTYTDNGVRSTAFLANTTNTPVYTNTTNFYTTNNYSESSDPGVAGTKEATVRLGVLQYDVTNYSTGYLPAGPNRSADTGTQYFTFAFRRTGVSTFDINITSASGITGCWLALPGTATDTSSSLNGWMRMDTTKGGAGYPGVNAPGNGNDGCAATDADRIASGVALSGGYTVSFGTVNSSSAGSTGNVILVRLALASGQSISALSIGAAA